MSFTPAQQFEELLKKTTAPLIIIPSYPSRDTIATAFALAFFLKQIGKAAHLAGENITTDKDVLSFVGEPDNLLPSITGARDFVLSFSTVRNKILNVRTETTPDELRVYLTPENGAIDPRDFSFIPAKFKFDLAIVIGSPDRGAQYQPTGEPGQEQGVRARQRAGRDGVALGEGARPGGGRRGVRRLL